MEQILRSYLGIILSRDSLSKSARSLLKRFLSFRKGLASPLGVYRASNRSHAAMLALGLVACAGAGCRPKPPEKASAPYLAKVGEVLITERELGEEMTRRAARGASLAPDKEVEAALQELVRAEVLFQKASAAGYDRRPDLKSQFKRLIISKFEEDEALKRADEEKVSAETIRAHYEAHRSDYTSEEKVRVAVLHVKMSPKAALDKVAAAKAGVEALRAKVIEETGSLADFGLLAQEHSDDQATRYRGGDCGFITRKSANVRWEAAVRDAAFSLTHVGEISPVIQVGDGFYLLKLMERKNAEVAALSAVSPRIERELRERLRRESRASFDEELKRGLRIEIDKVALRGIQPPLTPSRGTTSQPPQGPTQ